MGKASRALETGLQRIVVAAAERKPLKQKRDKKRAKKSANGKGSVMYGPHRPKLLALPVALDFHKAVKQIAVDDGLTLQKVVAHALNEYVKKRGHKVQTPIE
jgi:hypothetical protein